MININIVNKNNELIGSSPFLEAIKKDCIRQTVHIFIFDNNQKIFLQRRGKTAPLFPDKWDCSASGHVDEGEVYGVAAYRELKEEIGIKTELKYIETYLLEEESMGLKLKSFDAIYYGFYDGELILDPKEVSYGKWFSRDEINSLIKENPSEFTPGLILTLKKIDKFL